tara:strand:+ start:1296 stop:2015 length:720 start_codon:yes stop_codon:yes gene_type:complete
MFECVCSPLSKGGDEYSHFLGSLMKDCIYGSTDIISVILGLVNICLWTVATIPQLIENYRMKKVDALDFKFLFIWLVGDSMAFMGSIFTNQVPLMRYTGALFMMNDVVMILQWLYYKKIYTHKIANERVSLLASKNGKLGSNNTKMVTSVCIAICMVGVGVSAAPVTEPPLCNSPPNVSEFLKTLGIVFSWVSNVSYVVARIPQVSIISIAPVLRATAGSVKGNYKIRRLKQTNDGRRS